MKETRYSLFPPCLTCCRGWFSLLLTSMLGFAGICSLQADTSAQTERLIREHIEAAGGRAKLKTLNSLSMQGTIQSNTLTEELYITKKSGDKLRISFIEEELVQVITYDGVRGWEIMESEGTRGEPEAITGKRLEILKSAAAFTPPLLTFPNREWTYTSSSSKTIDDKECPGIIAQDNKGNEYHLYLDPQTHYVLEKDSILTIPNSENNKTITFTTRYKDIKQIDGYSFAHTVITTDGQGNSSTITFDKILINSGVFDSAFTPLSE